MKHVGPTRAELGTRTMFNLLGPQSNPSGVRHYMMGVFAQEWVEPVAAAPLANRALTAWVVHGSDGLDELTTTGPSFVAQIKDGNLTSFEVSPEDAGIPRARPDDLKGADPHYNATRLRALLDGEPGPYRDIVLLNAAAAFIVADKTSDLRSGVKLAETAIDSGKARQTLAKLVAVSNG
jgi:anthranilate phosphoribosyltransferase